MIRPLVLVLGILPATASAYFAAPIACYGPSHHWGAADFQYSPAQSYCSSHFPPRTVTKTTTAPTLTLTSTVATRTSTQALPGVITSVVATAPATTATVFATVFTTSTDTITSTLSTTSTSTSTITVTSTTSVRAAPPVKRAIETTGAQAFKELLSKGQAVIEVFCSCLVTSQVIKTVTTTPKTTVRATATTTTSVSSVLKITFTPTVTTISTVTAAAAPETITTTTTSTSVEVATTTTTSVTTVVVSPPSCDPNAPFGQQGAGGCSSNCYCDRDIDGVNHYCDSSAFCLGDCQSDNDCAIDQFCAAGTSCLSTGGRTCQKYSDCTSSFVPTLKRNVGLDAVPAVNQLPARALRAKNKPELSHLLTRENRS